MTSDAVSSERVSRTVGYKIAKGDFRLSSPNLPQRVVLLGEANFDNQADLDTTPYQITTAQQAGSRYGWGSPIHIQARILLPRSGGGLGGIPLIVHPQAQASGATAKVVRITITGTATKNGTHTIVVGGRESIDGNFYNININEGDSGPDVYAKIADALNNVLPCPFKALDTDYYAQLTSKWKGLTANKLQVSVNQNNNDLGLSYVVNVTQTGSATPDIQPALDAIGEEWDTILCNPYETTQVLTALEQFNGIAGDIPTGRFVAIVQKPFVAITGNTDDDPSNITDPREEEMTVAFAPAPNSPGLPMEAAACMTVLHAVVSQNTPHLDVAGKPYPDMPVPADNVIGSMSDSNTRDVIVKKGCSTVTLEGGQYIVQDFVTTYHPEGEEPPQFRWCRNLMIDNNFRYGWYLLEKIHLMDHAIAADDTIVGVTKVVKPKQWKQVINSYADDLSLRVLIVDAEFMKSNLDVQLNTTNPDRMDSNVEYKRSGFARISATTAKAGFNFGELTV